MTLRSKGPALLDQLLDQYVDVDNVSFVGEYLRAFVKYPTLLPAWFDLNRIKKLLLVILQPEFNIQSDAIETVQYLMIKDRAMNQEWARFISLN